MPAQPPPHKRRVRQREEEESENASLGRALVRLRQMWGSARDPVSKAFDLAVGSSDAEREAHSRSVSLFDWMIGHSPSLELQLAVETDDVWKVVKGIAKEIDRGRNEGQNSDTGAMKRGVASSFDILESEDEFGKWNPQLSQKERHESWGLCHPQIAPLLTPIGMDWYDEEDRSSLKSPGGIVDHRRWYPFMYEGRVVDGNDLQKGLFRGDLLVKAMNYILHRQPEKQKSSRNVAVIIGASEVTVELIAYITTLLRFALSSEPRIDGGFDSQSFYEHIVTNLHDLDDQWLEDLLEWWNSQIFPNQPIRRANIFPGDTFSEIRAQAHSESPPTSQPPEVPNGDLDGTEIGPGQRQGEPQSANNSSRRTSEFQGTIVSKKRSATAAGFEGGSQESEDETEEYETPQVRRTISLKLARAQLALPEDEERDEEEEVEEEERRNGMEEESSIGRRGRRRSPQAPRGLSTRLSPATSVDRPTPQVRKSSRPGPIAPSTQGKPKANSRR